MVIPEDADTIMPALPVAEKSSRAGSGRQRVTELKPGFRHLSYRPPPRRP